MYLKSKNSNEIFRRATSSRNDFTSINREKTWNTTSNSLSCLNTTSNGLSAAHPRMKKCSRNPAGCRIGVTRTKRDNVTVGITGANTLPRIRGSDKAATVQEPTFAVALLSLAPPNRLRRTRGKKRQVAFTVRHVLTFVQLPILPIVPPKFPQDPADTRHVAPDDPNRRDS